MSRATTAGVTGRKEARPVASYSVSEVTEGPFKGRFVVTRGEIVKAVFGTRAAAKRYMQQQTELTAAMR